MTSWDTAAAEAERVCQWLWDTHGIIADGLLAQVTDAMMRYEAKIAGQSEIIDRSSELIGLVRLEMVKLENTLAVQRRISADLSAENERLKEMLARRVA